MDILQLPSLAELYASLVEPATRAYEEPTARARQTVGPPRHCGTQDSLDRAGAPGGPSADMTVIAGHVKTTAPTQPGPVTSRLPNSPTCPAPAMEPSIFAHFFPREVLAGEPMPQPAAVVSNDRVPSGRPQPVVRATVPLRTQLTDVITSLLGEPMAQAEGSATRAMVDAAEAAGDRRFCTTALHIFVNLQRRDFVRVRTLVEAMASRVASAEPAVRAARRRMLRLLRACLEVMFPARASDEAGRLVRSVDCLLMSPYSPFAP